ncbi:MAG: DUF47 domain-containing protein [Fervidobacterium sp.]
MANIFNKLLPYRSPLELLLEHSKICVEASNVMEEAIKTYFEGGNIDDFSRKIDEFEEKADQLKVRLREIYAKLKWTYFSRVDFLDILHNADSIIDLIDDVLKVLTINKVEHIDEDVKTDILKLSRLVKESISHMNETANELQNIVESAFSPKEITESNIKAEVVENEEHSSDVIGLSIGKKLFAMKYEMNPVDIIFLNNVVVLLMRIEDRAKNVVERIKMITHI